MTSLRKATPNEGFLCAHDAGSKHITTLQRPGPKRTLDPITPPKATLSGAPAE